MMRTFVAWGGSAFGTLLAIPILLAGLPFWAVATFTRWLKSWCTAQPVKWGEVIQFDPYLGWRPKPNVHAVCDAPMAEPFRVVTDHEGWRGPASVEHSQLVVFGDSFGFGYPVDRPYFDIPLDGVRIKAMAADGYSMVQEFLLMTEQASRLRGKLVVWFVYSGNDLTDNLSPSISGYRSPCLLRSGQTWEIVTQHLKRDRWPAQRMFNFSSKVTAVFGETQTSVRVYEACEYLIGQGLSLCRSAGANLVVLTIPWLIQYWEQPWKDMNGMIFDPDMPDKRIGNICDRLGVPFVSGRKHFHLGHYIQPEGHLNEKGHRHLAMLLEQLYHSRLILNEHRFGRNYHESTTLPAVMEASCLRQEGG